MPHTKFADNEVYIIIPDATITTAMINHSTSKAKTDMRQNSSTLDRLIQTSWPPNSIFDNYVWFNQSEIVEEMKKTGWPNVE